MPQILWSCSSRRHSGENRICLYKPDFHWIKLFSHLKCSFPLPLWWSRLLQWPGSSRFYDSGHIVGKQEMLDNPCSVRTQHMAQEVKYSAELKSLLFSWDSWIIQTLVVIHHLALPSGFPIQEGIVLSRWLHRPWCQQSAETKTDIQNMLCIWEAFTEALWDLPAVSFWGHVGDIQPPGWCFESQWSGLSSEQTHGGALTRQGLSRLMEAVPVSPLLSKLDQVGFIIKTLLAYLVGQWKRVF